MPATATEKAVIVTTEHKEVYFGYTEDAKAEAITLNRARMCVYWSKDMKGILGLASKGPSKECRISEPAESIELRNITCVMSVTKAAADNWEKAPWSN